MKLCTLLFSLLFVSVLAACGGGTTNDSDGCGVCPSGAVCLNGICVATNQGDTNNTAPDAADLLLDGLDARSDVLLQQPQDAVSDNQLADTLPPQDVIAPPKDLLTLPETAPTDLSADALPDIGSDLTQDSDPGDLQLSLDADDGTDAGCDTVEETTCKNAQGTWNPATCSCCIAGAHQVQACEQGEGGTFNYLTCTCDPP